MCIPVPKGIIEDYLPLDMTTCQSSLLVRRSLHGIICIPVRKWIIEVYVPLEDDFPLSCSSNTGGAFWGSHYKSVVALGSVFQPLLSHTIVLCTGIFTTQHNTTRAPTTFLAVG